MSWRPKLWVTRAGRNSHLQYEGGADAMLEAVIIEIRQMEIFKLEQAEHDPLWKNHHRVMALAYHDLIRRLS